MEWWNNLVRGLGTANAPFGFAPVDSPSQGQVDPAYNAGMQMLGNVGMGMLASGEKNPMTALGKSYLVASQNAQQQNKDQYVAAQMLQEADAKKQERARKEELGNKWKQFVANNSDKFGQYAEFAPYLEPSEGMQILSGMQPDWRPATQEERASLGVGADVPLVIGKDGPRVLGGGGTTINMPKMDSAFDTEGGKILAKRYGDIVEAGGKATEMKGEIEALRDIGSMITTGKKAQAIAALGPYAEAFGIKIDGLSEMQAYEAIAARIAPSLRTPGVGSSSDFDAKQFLRSIPQLANNPGGNELIANTLEAVAEYKIQASAIAEAALTGELSREEANRQLRELGDPWTLWKQERGKYLTTSATPPATVKTDKGGSSVSDVPAGGPRLRYNPQTGELE